MAARFPEISCEEIEKLAEKAVNKNTVKTTKMWMNVWKSWAESKGLNNDIVKYEAKELDECLSRFFAEIRKSDGSDYEPDSLRVMLAALDRHLKQSDSKISIAKDREFVKCRQVLEGKARALREKGHGKRPNATKALTVQDEENLWKNRVLGEQNPKSLLYTLWYLLTLHFGLRGCQEHHEMFVEDFTFNKDDQGTEYVTFEENPTKTRQGGLRKKRRAIQPKMFATGGPRCPVQFFKTYLAHRPEEMRNSGPFYLAIIDKPKSEVWYKKQRMGVNKIDSFMKNMALEAELDVEGRKLTNHSVRKTLVKKLKASNQPRSAIIGVTGHTSERSLADYEEGDEAEQREISSIISSSGGQQVQNSRPVLSSLPIQHNQTATPASQTVVHHFHGCQVTINYGAGVGVFQQSSN